ARPGGFLNRLTGLVRPTLNQVLAEEFSLLAARYRLIARWFNQWAVWRCIDGPSNFAGCRTDCDDGADASVCSGIGVIFLCAPFWTYANTNRTDGPAQQASILMHEAAHIIWTPVGDDPVRGPGGNFRVAYCYENFVADIIGFPPLTTSC